MHRIFMICLLQFLIGIFTSAMAQPSEYVGFLKNTSEKIIYLSLDGDQGLVDFMDTFESRKQMLALETLALFNVSRSNKHNAFLYKLLRSQSKSLKELFITRAADPDSGFSSSNFRTVLQMLSGGNLQVLRWENQRDLDFRIGAESLIPLVDLWQELRVLSLTGTEISDEKFFELDLIMPNLVELDLRDCGLDKDVLFKIFSQPEKYPSLEKLQFDKNRLRIHKWKKKNHKRFLSLFEFQYLKYLSLADTDSDKNGYSELLTQLNEMNDNADENTAKVVMPITGIFMRGSVSLEAKTELEETHDLSEFAETEVGARELLEKGVRNLTLYGIQINTRILDFILQKKPPALQNVFCMETNISYAALENYRERFRGLEISLHSIKNSKQPAIGDVPQFPREPAPKYIMKK